MGRESTKRDITILSNDNQLWKKFLRQPRSGSFVKENQTPVKQIIKEESIVYIVGNPIDCTRPSKRISELPMYRYPLEKITEAQLMTLFSDSTSYPIFETEEAARNFIKAADLAHEELGRCEKSPVIAKVFIKIGASVENKQVSINPILLSGDATLAFTQNSNNVPAAVSYIHSSDIKKFYSLKLEANNKVYEHNYQTHPKQITTRCVMQ